MPACVFLCGLEARTPREGAPTPIPSREGWPVGPGWVPGVWPRGNPPRRFAAPLQGGDKKAPLLGGVAEGRGGFRVPVSFFTPGSAGILPACLFLCGLEARTPRAGDIPIPSREGWPVGPGWVPSATPRGNPPRCFAAPLQGGDNKAPLFVPRPALSRCLYVRSLALDAVLCSVLFSNCP